METENPNNKPYKIKDVTRNIKKALVASTLDEVKTIAAKKFEKTDQPTIHLDSDGTEIDDEDYFQTLEPNTELIAVFSGEEWTDPTQYVTITTRRESADATDSADVERVHLKNLFGQLKQNLRNVSILSDPDLELLSNMDPNSLADITGKDFVEQIKDVSGRILHEKREAINAIELLRVIAKQQGVTISVLDSPTSTDGEMITDEATMASMVAGESVESAVESHSGNSVNNNKSSDNNFVKGI